MVPNVINYHITNRCNNHCTYCFAKHLPNELQINDAKKVIDAIEDFFKKNKVKNGRVNFSGGEPFLYPHLCEIAEYAKRKKLRVSIISSISSLHYVDQIIALKKNVEMIGLSIDSVRPDTLKKIGRGYNDSSIIQTMYYGILADVIHSCKIKLKINTVVSTFNQDETELGYVYRKMKPDRLKFLCVHSVENINADTVEHIPTERNFENFVYWNFYGDEKGQKCETVIEGPESMENSYLIINPQGDVCLNTDGKEITYGNCLRESLADIYHLLPIDMKKVENRENNKNRYTSKKIVD